MISFVIPAHNEEAVLAETLAALFASAKDVGEPFEVIVSCDACSDRTVEIARAAGARAIEVNNRQIAATRNCGAKEAKGEVLFFIDADTLVPPDVIRGMLKAVANGAVGGGARVKFSREVPFWASVFLRIFSLFYFLRYAAGCAVFARREAFEKVGGFDQRYYASEEVHLSRALRRQGPFKILREAVSTSPRKLHLYSMKEWRAQMWRMMKSGGRAAERREDLDIWYDGRREKSEQTSEKK